MSMTTDESCEFNTHTIADCSQALADKMEAFSADSAGIKDLSAFPESMESKDASSDAADRFLDREEILSTGALAEEAEAANEQYDAMATETLPLLASFQSCETNPGLLLSAGAFAEEAQNGEAAAAAAKPLPLLASLQSAATDPCLILSAWEEIEGEASMAVESLPLLASLQSAGADPCVARSAQAIAEGEEEEQQTAKDPSPVLASLRSAAMADPCLPEGKEKDLSASAETRSIPLTAMAAW
jgi:hypothetical protein